MKRSIFTLFILLFFVLFPVAHAQIGDTQSDVNVNMVPENPTPNQVVVVSLVSYSTDINAATITWSINGKISKSGKGEKTFSFTTGNPGTQTTLGISVITREGQTINKTINVKPATIDLTWQSESYTPPFYRGKAMFSLQNKITFIAIPHILGSNGAEISPKNLIYKWTKNGSVAQNDSGYGKNTFTVPASLIPRPLDITVEITSSDGNETGFATTNISGNDPFVLFYEKNPLYGIEFQNALTGTIEMKDSKEIAVVAVPFFFGTTNPYKYLSYKWQINGVTIDDDLSQATRVFRQVEGTSGTANISLSIENASKILQLAKNNFNLTFGTPNATESAL